MSKLQIIVFCVTGLVVPSLAVLALNKDRIITHDKRRGTLLYFAPIS